MKKRIQKSLCALLALIMLLSIVPVSSVSAAPAGDRLDGWNETIYDFLKTNVAAVANGDQASTEFTLSDTNGIMKWSKEDLGVSTLISGNAIAAEAQAALTAKFNEAVDLDAIMNSLLADCPYDLYWYDKVTGVSMSYNISVVSNEMKITRITFKLAVCQEYAVGQYTVDTDTMKSVASITDNAMAIVEKHADKSDWDKLVAYKDEICDLVSYNHAAADSPSTPYGNPWQLIYVFDMDSSTNVVCEGYAKAFKLLCDLTNFQDDVYCYTVTGYMQGGTGAGDHMWNVVDINGGRLMADVTNCDAGTIGAPDLLFLTAGSKYGDSYSFPAGNSTIYYTYDPDEYGLYTDGYLELTPVPEQEEDPEISTEPTTPIDPLAIKFDEIVGYCDTFYESIPWYVVCKLSWDLVDWGHYEEELPVLQIPAAEYEAAAAKYCVLTESMLNAIRNETDYEGNPIYDPETNTYTVFFVGGWGGFLHNRVYAGYVKTGEDTYDVYYMTINYEFLDEILPDGTSLEDVVGEDWPEKVEYEGHTYTNGPDGYFRIAGYSKSGIKYGVKYDGENVMIATRTPYSVGQQPENFDDITIEDILTYEIVDSEAIVTDCADTFSGEITIPNTLGGYPVTTIALNAFEYCYMLTGITLPDSLTSIDSGAFYCCERLSEITIPASVTSIGDGAFYACSSLTGIWVESDNPNYSSDAYGVLFNKDKTQVIRSHEGLTDYIIPSGVTVIGNNAFDGCSNLTSVIIPESVTDINPSAFYRCSSLRTVTIPCNVAGIGNNAFACCYSLDGIWVDSNNAGFCSDDYGVLFDINKTRLIQAPGMIANYAIPDSVSTIGSCAFSGCKNLTDIAIPGSVRSIEISAFNSCVYLANVTFFGSENQWNAIPKDMDNDALYTATIHFEFDGPVSTDPEYLTYEIVDGEAIVTDCADTFSGEITIPNTLGGYPVTTIAEFAFAHLTNPISVNTGNSVKTISNAAFLGCYGLESVTLGDNVQSVDKKAFEACDNLQSFAVSANNPNFSCVNGVLYNKNQTVLLCAPKTVSGEFTIPGGVLTVGEYAFDGCMSLTDLVVGNDVTTIGKRAFNNCMNLTSVKLGSSVKTIDEYAFMNCSRINKLIAPLSLTDIKDHAFERCTGLTDIYYAGTQSQWIAVNIGGNNEPIDNATIHYESDGSAPADPWYLSYEIIDGGAIITACDTSIEGNLELPATLGGYPITGIGDNAFLYCQITDITLPETLETIGNNAFGWTALRGIYIPAGVHTIGQVAFQGCPDFTGYTVSQDNPYFSSDNYGVLFNEPMTQLISAPCALTGTYYVPDTVTTIPMGAFMDCEKLENLYIPQSATNLAVSGGGFFKGCTNLQGVWVDSKNPTYRNDEYGALLSKDNWYLYFVPNTLSGTYRVPDGVVYVDHAFDECAYLSGIFFPEGVGNISADFSQCISLKRLYIPASLNSMNFRLYELYEYQADIYYAGTLEQWDSIYSLDSDMHPGNLNIMYNCDPAIWDLSWYISDGGAYINDCNENATGIIIVPDTLNGYPVIGIDGWAFQDRDGITEVHLPDSVTYIGMNAFAYCDNLTTVTMSGNVSVIGTGAFTNCTSLTAFEIPEDVGTIEDTTFYGCTSLTEITIPNGVAVIGESAFNGCTNLTNISIPGSVSVIGDYAFNECTSLTNVVLPYGVTNIGREAFRKCTSLKSISLPNSLISIGMYAFKECNWLKSIVIPDSVTEVGAHIFQYCSNLKTAVIGSGLTRIPNGMFWACVSLEEITIPATVTDIDMDVFHFCDNLTDVYYLGTEAQKSNITVEDPIIASATWHCNSCIGSAAHTYDNGCDAECNVCFAQRAVTHTFDNACDSTCNFCPYTRVTSHSYTNVITKATQTKDGAIETKCSGCGDVTSSTIIPRIDVFSHPDHWFIYDGTQKTPVPIVWDREGNALIEGQDYTISYPANRTELGEYTLTITFKGNYSGTKTLTFEILLGTPTTSAANTTTGVNVSWNAVTGAKSYNVYKSVNTGGKWSSWTAIKTGVTGTTYTDTSVKSNDNVKYMVRAVNGSHLSDYEASSAIKFLAAPTVTVSNATNGVKISWNAISGAKDYKVYKSVYSGGKWSSWTAIKTGVTGTTYTDTSVKSNDNVKYTIRAFNGSYSSTYKSSSSIKFLATPTVTVSNTTTGVKATWNAIPGAKTYTVYKSVNTNGKWSAWKAIKTGVTGTTYTDTTVKSNDNVKYMVKAINGSYVSSYAGSSAIKFLATPNVTVANTTTGVKVSWNKITGAKTYTVYKSVNTNGKWSAWKAIKTGVTGTSYTDTSVKSNDNVKYTVRAVNSSYISSYKGSAAIKFLKNPTVRAANAAKGVTVTWNKITGAKSYDVYRSVYSNGKWSGWTKIKTGVTGTSYTDTGVKSGATVKYTVRAVNGSYASSYAGSNSTKFLAQPTVKVAKASNGIKVTWGKIAGASGYTVYRRTYSNGKWSGWTALKNTTAVSYTDTTAKAGVTYQYTVRAYSGSYKSSYTNSTSIKR